MRDSDVIVCADSGAKHALTLGITPHAIVGDLDSIDATTLDKFRMQNVEIICESEQESDDFEKALRYVLKRNVQHVAILGNTGLRTDHLLTNLSVMLRWRDRFSSVIAYDNFASYRFLTTMHPLWEHDLTVGTVISLLPYGLAEGVTTQNLQYVLRNEPLQLGIREGLSNVVIGSPASVRIQSGALLVIIANERP